MFTLPDLGVHVAPIRLFTFRRFRRSRSGDLGVHVPAISAFTLGRFPHAFANNLEVTAFEDFPLTARQHPSLFELRRFLEYLADGTTLSSAAAFKRIVDVLPQEAGRAVSGSQRFVHSADPAAFSRGLAEWIGSPPRGHRERCETLLASPFFPATGKALERYCSDDLKLDKGGARPFTLILDGRAGGELDQGARSPDGPHATPPPWLESFRAPGSMTYVPNTLSKRRSAQVEADKPLFRGTGQRGRALHAKLLATRFAHDAASDGGLWRIFVGSANFTEAGLGLLGQRSNVEAGFLTEVDDADEGSFGLAKLSDALCVEHTPSLEHDREAADEGFDLQAVFAATARGKEVVAALERSACVIERQETGYGLQIALPPSVPAEVELWLGKQRLERQQDGAYCCTVPSLEPYHLRVVTAGVTMAWPLPAENEAVSLALVAAAGAKRRVDRLLDFWLMSGSTLGAEGEEDVDLSGGDGQTASEALGQEQLGSWRLNRLLLGVRRRLAESVAKVGGARLPSATNLLESIRIRELIELIAELPDPDALYLGTLVQAVLVGYRASEARAHRESIEVMSDDPVVSAWRKGEGWRRADARLKQAAKVASPKVRALLRDAAHTLFLSVREGEVVQ